MSELNLDAIEQRANAATKPPWKMLLGAVGAGMEWFLTRPGCDGVRAWGEQDLIDFDFAAAAREYIPALIARVRELEAIIEATAREHECVAINADVWVHTRDPNAEGKPWIIRRNNAALIGYADTLWEAIAKGLADANTKEPA